MTGHAFQEFVADDEIRASLAAIHAALAVGGVFAFETRNPLAREWERWNSEHGVEFVAADGASVRYEAEVETPVSGDIVRFTNMYTSAGWDRPERSHSTLRFLDADALSRFLIDAGFVIQGQYGGWDRSPLLDACPEIITIARRSRSTARRRPAPGSSAWPSRPRSAGRGRAGRARDRRVSQAARARAHDRGRALHPDSGPNACAPPRQWGSDSADPGSPLGPTAP